MASATIPAATGGLGAAAVAYYYTILRDHDLDTVRDKSAFAVKYALLLTGGFAVGRWVGVSFNAIDLGTFWATVETFPGVFLMLAAVKAALLYHILSEYL